MMVQSYATFVVQSWPGEEQLLRYSHVVLWLESVTCIEED